MKTTIMTTYANPLELAKAELGSQFDSVDRPITDADEETIKRLHIAARDNGFFDLQYWVKTAQGIVMPAEIPNKIKRFSGSLIELRSLTFVGELEGFHKFSIGNRIGAWCLSFSEATLVPGFERMPDDDQLWVPAVSVRQIGQL